MSLTHSHGPTPLLRGLDFTVGAGEIYALLGGNGAGKSTMLGLFPLIIEGRSLDRAAFTSLPVFSPRASSASLPRVPLLALCGFGLLALGAGFLSVRPPREQRQRWG